MNPLVVGAFVLALLLFLGVLMFAFLKPKPRGVFSQIHEATGSETERLLIRRTSEARAIREVNQLAEDIRGGQPTPPAPPNA